MTIAADSLDKVRRTVLDALDGMSSVKVVLFGSRAVGTAHRRSDIDVGVLSEVGFSNGLLADLREKLEELNIPYTVDLVDLCEVNPTFMRQVIQEGIIWRS